MAPDDESGAPADPPAAARGQAGLVALYGRVEALLARHRPRCEMSGRCCDFPRSGTQLWASTLEVERALEAAGGVVPPAPSGLCPWWVDGLCRLREGRPLGCRLYFCDPGWADEMGRAYERFHGELKALHDAHGVPYAYRRFVDAVRGSPAVAAPSAPPPPAPGTAP